MPSFNSLMVFWTRGRPLPPINSFACVIVLCISTRIFRIIILLKSVTIRILLRNEAHQPNVKDVSIPCGCYIPVNMMFAAPREEIPALIFTLAGCLGCGFSGAGALPYKIQQLSNCTVHSSVQTTLLKVSFRQPYLTPCQSLLIICICNNGTVSYFIVDPPKRVPCSCDGSQ